ncbi:hypothetical protein NEOLEDRAFT_1134891 [Neolentinus lepideus HHB14362 ss-1]|uniref:Caffeine-induced death protein 2 n=1 Tax=Neolentinus lepideus HHB14362 ss-1 TaxID=1314782 RepID=A0A165S0P9_9AGAM|nr:hypothetical protein NEOLEDRAFT_1134891 [Neolentinus lepideus HHB14362 ss-1]
MPSTPVLGSLALQGPSPTPQIVHVSPSTCQNLSLFKDLLKEYRKLDDSIGMRINRTTAQFREKNRQGSGSGESVENQACAYIWRQLLENWKRRTQIIEYCVGVVDASMDEKRNTIEDQADKPAEQRKLQAQLYAEEVKRNQVHNELTVEKIIRQRSLDAFRSRCRYFEPPSSDTESRSWWDSTRGGT